ncbi:hypothetical protein PG985_011506 [Apiospora marii]|uniref:Uncharacterized protein n=1 Tax=Apiospora marii TaxID=335849 RepID=A0ABR1R0Y2_9PEZI
MGNQGSKPDLPDYGACYDGMIVPWQSARCYAPPVADPATTYLTVSMDRGGPHACHPNLGGDHHARIEYTGRDGRTHEDKAKGRPDNIPDDWEGMLDFDFGVSYQSIEPGSIVTVFVTAEKMEGEEMYQSFTYQGAFDNRRAVVSNDAVGNRTVEVACRQALPFCE